MKAFVFSNVSEVSAHWHSEGGLLIVAESKERAKELIEKEKYVTVTDEEWKDVIVINALKIEPERLIVLPDVGFCG